jgi:hypothetical protein
MYLNRKMYLLKPFQEWEGRGIIRENGGGTEFKYGIFYIYYKKCCKCHNVHPSSTTIKNIN